MSPEITLIKNIEKKSRLIYIKCIMQNLSVVRIKLIIFLISTNGNLSYPRLTI